MAQLKKLEMVLLGPMENPFIARDKQQFIAMIQMKPTIPEDIKQKALEMVAPLQPKEGNTRGTYMANQITDLGIHLLLGNGIRDVNDDRWNQVREALGLPIVPSATEMAAQNAVIAANNAAVAAQNAVIANEIATRPEVARTNNLGIQYNKNNIPVDPKYNRFRGIPLQHEYSGDPLVEYFELRKLINANRNAIRAARQEAPQMMSTPLAAANQSGFFATALGYGAAARNKVYGVGSTLRGYLPFGGKRTRKHRAKKTRKARGKSRKH